MHWIAHISTHKTYLCILCGLQIYKTHFIQEAQLLLGDRATRKHAKDS